MNPDVCKLLNDALQQQLQSCTTLAQALASCDGTPQPARPEGEQHPDAGAGPKQPAQPPKR